MTLDPSISTIQLDWRGLKCPAPILNTAKEARKLGTEHSLLRILADDDAFPMDLKSWCRSSKARVLSIDRVTNGAYQAVVEINSAAAAPVSRPLSFSAPTTPQDLTPPTSKLSLHEKEFDFRGMLCPAPILALAKAVRPLKESSFKFTLLADDAAFPMDLKSWCKSAGVSLLSLEERDGVFVASIQKLVENVAPAPVNTPAPKPAQTPAPELLTPASQPVTPTPQHAAPAPQDQHETTIKLVLDDADSAASVRRLNALNALGLTSADVTITSPHIARAQDIIGWCSEHNHTLQHFESSATNVLARVQLNPDAKTTALVPVHKESETALVPAQESKACTLLILHNDFAALMAALMCANASAASGVPTKIYFSFWGVNLLRADSPRNLPIEQKPTFLQRMFKWMMPKGPGRQQLGQLNFGGFGTAIMKGLMQKHQIMNLNQLMDSAIEQGVEFVICTTSMTIMGLNKRDLGDFSNLQYGGVASFMDDSKHSDVSLVF